MSSLSMNSLRLWRLRSFPKQQQKDRGTKISAAVHGDESTRRIEAAAAGHDHRAEAHMLG